MAEDRSGWLAGTFRGQVPKTPLSTKKAQIQALRKAAEPTDLRMANSGRKQADSVGPHACLREQERTQAVKELLLALRDSPDGDLLRSNPATPGDGAYSTAQAIIGALVEAFSIVPIRNTGDRIPVCAVKNSGSVKGSVSNQLFWIFRTNTMRYLRHDRTQPRHYFVHQ